jgi:hypothetical protein
MEEGLPVIDADNESVEMEEGLPVIDADNESVEMEEGLPDIDVDMDGREDGAELDDAEGHIIVSAGQFDNVGSQHVDPVDPLLLPYRAVDDGDTETFLKSIVAEGDGVIMSAMTSEHKGSPDVHDPLAGSQHRIPFILVSPGFWLAPVAIAAKKRMNRNMLTLLMYELLFQKNNISHFFYNFSCV